MKPIKKFFLTIFLFFFVINSNANNSPESVAKKFYDWRFKAHFTGVPEAATLKTARQFLSPELICLLDRARIYRDRFTKKFPTDKPPFIEGDMFTSVFEGANRYTQKSVKLIGDNAIVQLRFYHDQGMKIDGKGWQDSVLLRQKNNQWRIADIKYDGKFDFGNSGSLRQNLLEELAKDNLELDWHSKAQLKLCH